MTDRTDYIAGLRQLADWLEGHDEVAVPYVASISLPLTRNDSVERFAAAAGVSVQTDDDGNASAHIRFGPIDYYAYGYADWDQHYAQRMEERARSWADEHGMTLQPREDGDES